MPYIKLTLCIFTILSIATARTFTSSDGIRKIDASITSYDKDSAIVSIIRKDGKTFNSKLSSFSIEDQAYILKWFEGANENYLYFGKEFPGHLKMFLKILNAGGVGYGQTVLFRPGLSPLVIGNGSTPFLAWVDGYNKLDHAFGRFNATRISFDLIKNNWQASISYQTGAVVSQNSPIAVVPSGNLNGLQSVGGPIIYQQPQRIVMIGKNAEPNSVIVLPREPAPVFINPYSRGMNINGMGIYNGGYFGVTRTYSKGNGISIRINR